MGGNKAVFQVDSAGVRAALSQAGVQREVNQHAAKIAGSACAMCGDDDAFGWAQGVNSNVAIANVHTAIRHGRYHQSKHKTLRKAAGV